MSNISKTKNALNQAAQAKINSLCIGIDDPIIINSYTQRVNNVLNQITAEKWSKRRIRHEAKQNSDIRGVNDTVFVRDICIFTCDLFAMC
jgi:hypothetical protein